MHPHQLCMIWRQSQLYQLVVYVSKLLQGRRHFDTSLLPTNHLPGLELKFKIWLQAPRREPRSGSKAWQDAQLRLRNRVGRGEEVNFETFSPWTCKPVPPPCVRIYCVCTWLWRHSTFMTSDSYVLNIKPDGQCLQDSMRLDLYVPDFVQKAAISAMHGCKDILLCLYGGWSRCVWSIDRQNRTVIGLNPYSPVALRALWWCRTACRLEIFWSCICNSGGPVGMHFGSMVSLSNSDAGV